MVSKRQQWFWLYPLLVAGVVACIGWWADYSVRTALQSKLRSELLAALEANVTSLDVWIRTQKRLASGIASEEGVLRESMALLAPPESPGGPPSDPSPPDSGDSTQRRGPPGPPLTPAARRFFETLDARMRPAGYFIAQLVTTNGLIIADTGPGRVKLGSSVNEDHQAAFAELFASGEPVIITPFRPRMDRFRGPGSPRGSRPQNDPGRGGPSGPGWDRAGPDNTNARPDRTGPGGTGRRNGFPGANGPGWPGNPGGPSRDGGPRPDPPPGQPPGPGNPPPRFLRPTGGLMQVAAPVRDAAGRVRGALAFVLNPELEFSRILASVRQGESGETYAFDDNGLMLSQSRFDAQLRRLGLIDSRPETSSALNLELKDPGRDLTSGQARPATNEALPLIPLVARAIKDDGAAGVDALPTRDFRGVPVVGAWRWLTNHQFGVVTQIDASEAYQPLRALRSIFLLLITLLAIAAAAALLNSYWNLAWRRKADEAELKLRTLGQYTLEEKIGAGAMGVVHRARHALLRRETAVKLLLPDRANESTIRQFEQEVQLTCRLTHPNTIQIYDFGRTPDGTFYYAMEYLRGLNLAELVYRHGPQREARVLHILVQVCESLSEAHALGLVHRDIKPANIILCERGGIPDSVKVLDFGLVKPLAAPALRDTGPTPEPRLSGTPLYLPPESIRNPGHSEPRGDLYALGAVGYHLLTGRPPFEGPTIGDVLTQHLEAIPAPPGRHAPGPVSPELEALILRCLAKDPADRPASACILRDLLMACPASGAWTLACRSDWWKLNPPTPDSAANPSARPPSTELDATVAATLHIDLAARGD